MSTTEDEEVVTGEIVPDPGPRYAIVPHTGEAVDLDDAPDEFLAALLEEVRVWETDRLRAFKREVQEEILARMDRQAAWTINAGTFKLSGDAPGRVEYDVPALMAAVQGLIDRGLVTADAGDKAIREKVTYEAAVAGVKALKKLGGEVAAAIEACELPSSRPRAVRVTGGLR